MSFFFFFVLKWILWLVLNVLPVRFQVWRGLIVGRTAYKLKGLAYGSKIKINKAKVFCFVLCFCLGQPSNYLSFP